MYMRIAMVAVKSPHKERLVVVVIIIVSEDVVRPRF